MHNLSFWAHILLYPLKEQCGMICTDNASSELYNRFKSFMGVIDYRFITHFSYKVV